MRDPILTKQLEDACSSVRVELRERIIEQDEWTASDATKSRGFEKTQRDRRRALLTRRAKRAQLVTIQSQLDVVTMWARMRDSTPEVGGAMRTERIRENRSELGHRNAGSYRAGCHRRGRVADSRFAALTDRSTELVKILRDTLDPRHTRRP